MPDSLPYIHDSGRIVTWRLGVAALARLFINTALRLGYPFAPVLSRGLGVPLTSFTTLLAISQVTGMLGLITGPLSDSWGRRRMLVAGSAMLGGGMLLGGAFPTFASVLVALFLAGVGKMFHSPALQAYVGEWVPYKHRGRATGLIEFSWAGSLLLGVPLVALLISRLGWQAPFFFLGTAGLVSAAAILILFPVDRQQLPGADIAAGLLQSWRLLSKESAALFLLLFAFLLGVANLNLFVVYGVWMEGSFGLGLVALGTTGLVIGIAELLGEGLTASIADRVGLKQSVSIGSVLLVLSYCLLPGIGHSLSTALIGLFIIFLIFEFVVVTLVSLATEILPGAPATMISGLMAASSLGRVLGASLGGPVWLAGGLTATSLLSAVITALALVCLIWGLRGWRAGSNEQ